MKVLHIIDSGGFYGAEAMLLELCIQQRKMGVDAQVLSIGELGNYEKAIETKLRENNIPVHIWRMRPLPNLVASYSWSKWAREQGFVLIHSHGYKGNILFGLLPHSLRKLPLVATLHGWTRQGGANKLRLYEWLDGLVLRHLNAVVAVNPLMLNQPELISLNPRRLHTVLNGIGSNKVPLDRSIESKLVALKANSSLIGSIGRLSPEKGYDLLIQAFAKIRQIKSDVQLVILGEGKERSNLQKLIEESGLSENVTLLGYVENAGIYMQYFDIYINSSRTEGLPITFLEAMRCRCPIVATGIPTTKSFTKNGEFAFLAEPESAKSIAEITLTALQQGDIAKLKAEKAEHYFLENHTALTMCEGYRRIYETVHGS